MINFRDSHTWCRGYSDALAGKPYQPQDFHDPAVYARGYAVGDREAVRAELKAAA